jgi:hypothetical protein
MIASSLSLKIPAAMYIMMEMHERPLDDGIGGRSIILAPLVAHTHLFASACSGRTWLCGMYLLKRIAASRIYAAVVVVIALTVVFLVSASITALASPSAGIYLPAIYISLFVFGWAIAIKSTRIDAVLLHRLLHTFDFYYLTIQICIHCPIGLGD